MYVGHITGDHKKQKTKWRSSTTHIVETSMEEDNQVIKMTEGLRSVHKFQTGGLGIGKR